MTWQEAKTECNLISGRLVMIETEEEQALLVAEKKKRSILPPYMWIGYMWIGLNDLSEEDVWRWTGTVGLRTTFSAWGRSQPNSYNGEQDCVAMDFANNNGKWNDFWCNKRSWESRSIGAICEL